MKWYTILILKERNITNSEKDTQDLDFHPLLLQLQIPSQNPAIQSSERKWDNKLCLVPWIFDIGILPMLNSQSIGFHVGNVCKMCIEMRNSKLAYCHNQNYLPLQTLNCKLQYRDPLHPLQGWVFPSIVIPFTSANPKL